MSKKIATYIFALAGILVLFSSCKKEYESIESIDDAKIQAYIKKNNLDMTKDPSGFYYHVVTPGSGAAMLNKDSVFFTTNVKSLSGISYYPPVAFSAQSTYLGYINPVAYRTALHAINRGGKVQVILPSYMAYGKNGDKVVPPNEVIVTDLEVYPYTTQWQMDDRIINDFLTANKLTAVKYPSRVYVIVSQEGTGTVVEAASNLTVKYKGRYLNGTVFDQGDALSIYLYQAVKGWEKTLVGMKKGAKLRMFVPSDLAYGPSPDPTTGIPPNAILDFDVELTEVTN